MASKPWYKVVTPREDLREERPLDASEFAVHLDHIREGRAPDDYQQPKRFFERTYLTGGLENLSSEVVRRLSGIRVETSAVFNMATQFGGGKTHALALLYHLAKGGPGAASWMGVSNILGRAGVNKVPEAATAVFVGTEFDSISGRGGTEGEPMRKTPWGEIAWQLGGVDSFKIVEEHDKMLIAPGNDVIRKLLPKDRPCLILMDELMNYISRFRKMGLVTQFYNFLHNLSEEVRSQDRVVLVVSIPASELEMTAEDQSDYERFKKLLDRVGKAVVISAENETSEIIRRRLFEWNGVPEDAKKTISEYAGWIIEHRNQVGDFPVDHAREAFLTSYPFHPSVLSVFERKWQALPRFQQTRGILRLLALWVSKTYQDGFKGAQKDPLITLGTAPLDDPKFRAALFEQLGESRLEVAVTSDISGKANAHAVRLDREAIDLIKKARLHQKVATTIFFESNGGQTRAEATIPEIRLAVAGPELDVGNIETVLETLSEACYYLSVERNRYKFTHRPQLPKLLADRRAIIKDEKIRERIRAEIQTVFKIGSVDKVFFPEKSGQISDRAALTLVILPPDQSLSESKKTLEMIGLFTKEYGSTGRHFKSALIWAVPDTSSELNEEARKLLAWEEIKDEKDDLRLDDTQKRQLEENLTRARRDLKESVWRAYKNILLLDKNNQIRHIDMGLVHSSAAESIISLIINRLRQEGDIEDGISPNFLIRNWPPAFKEWSTRSVRDAFFASPQFPRLLQADTIKDTIAKGVSNGILAYVGKTDTGEYSPFYFEKSLSAGEVEISDEMYIITKEIAGAYKAAKITSTTKSKPDDIGISYPTGGALVPPTEEPGAGFPQPGPSSPISPVVSSTTKLAWNGEVPPQKWMNFYTKVISKFANESGLKLVINVEVTQEEGISKQKVEETKTGLRELGLDDEVTTE